MKITMIAPTYPYKGGISLNATLLGEELAKNHELMFVSWKRQVPRSFVKNPFDPELPRNEKASFDLTWYNPATWILKAVSIGTFKPDVLIHHWVSPFFGVVYFTMNAIVKLISPRTKIVYVCHNVSPHDPSIFVKVLRKIGFCGVQRFLVHAHSEKDKLLRLKPRARIHLAVPPALIDPRFHKRCDPQEVVRFKREHDLGSATLLFFGYIRPYKGLEVLLNAMKGLKSKLIVVGEFWEPKKKYEDMVSRLEIQDQVIFVDAYVPDREVPIYFSAADAVVLPYVSATQSGPLLMAYAFEKPVIASAVGGLKDVVEHGRSGYLVPPGDPAALRSAAQKLIDERADMSECIRAMNEKHNFKNYANAILSLR